MKKRFAQYRRMQQIHQRDVLADKLIESQAYLIILRNELGKTEGLIDNAAINVLLETGTQAVAEALLPPALRSLKSSLEVIDDLIGLMDSKDSAHLQSLFCKIVALAPGVSLFVTMVNINQAIQNQVEKLEDRKRSKQQELAMLGDLIRDMKTELSRLGQSGLFLDKVG